MDKQVYIGLDASLDETSICVVDCDGKIVFETKAESDPTSLHCPLKGYVERAERIGIEASSVGVWLARELLFRQLPVILVEARHMRTSLSAMRNKTDKNDARGIAQMMRMGWYRAVHVKGVENQRLRDAGQSQAVETQTGGSGEPHPWFAACTRAEGWKRRPA